MELLKMLWMCYLLAIADGATTLDLLKAEPNKFSTLVSLLELAGLTDTLNNGTYTLFAPSNAAFMKVPANAIAALKNDTAGLASLLLYHAAGGKILSSAAVNEAIVYMENGQQARVNVYSKNNVVTIQGQTISEFDKVASNGVVHVLDGVMMTPSGDNLQTVARMGRLSTLVSLVVKANLAQALRTESLTIFAPTDDAFAELPKDQLEHIMGDVQLLTNILTYHVVNGTFFSAGLYSGEVLPTLNEGNTLMTHISHDNSVVKINTAIVVEADIGTTTGTVHIIDKVLVPPTGSPVVG